MYKIGHRKPPSGWNKGKGKAYAWLVEHVGYEGDDCLIWPFSINKQDGYGMLGHLGEHFYAHSKMCEMVNGPRPSPQHECAHSCGNGHKACIHPKHVSWKTKTENALDRSAHGNQAAGREGFKLTFAQAQQIRALKGTATQRAIGDRFGVSARTVRDVFNGRTFRSEQTLLPPAWTPEEDQKLISANSDGLTDAAAAKIIGRSALSVCRRRNLLNLPSTRDRT